MSIIRLATDNEKPSLEGFEKDLAAQDTLAESQRLAMILVHDISFDYVLMIIIRLFHARVGFKVRKPTTANKARKTMTTILVTGATGTIGSQLVEALAGADVAVRAGVRDPQAEGAALTKSGAQAVHFDFEDAQSMRDALEGVDRLFLLTPFVEEPVPLLQAAIDVAKEVGVKFVLRMSSLGADASAGFALARHHGEGEQRVERSGIPYAIIRPCFFMENLIKFAGPSIRGEGAFYGAAQDGRVAYISGRDVARTAASILLEPNKHEGAVHELSGPRAHTESEAAKLIGAAIDKDVRYVSIPNDDLRAALSAQDMPGWVVDALASLEDVKAQGWASTVSAAVPSLTGTHETLEAFVQRNASQWRGEAGPA